MKISIRINKLYCWTLFTIAFFDHLTYSWLCWCWITSLQSRMNHVEATNRIQFTRRWGGRYFHFSLHMLSEWPILFKFVTTTFCVQFWHIYIWTLNAFDFVVFIFRPLFALNDGELGWNYTKSILGIFSVSSAHWELTTLSSHAIFPMF